MPKRQPYQEVSFRLTNLPLQALRERWTQAWDQEPHPRIGRAMLEKGLGFKLREARNEGLSKKQRERLNQLVSAYKRNPRFFDEGLSDLKPGVRLVKNYGGEHHSVLVHLDGYEYRDKRYGSLSEIATVITGTRWNGWVFFGLKKRKEKNETHYTKMCCLHSKIDGQRAGAGFQHARRAARILPCFYHQPKIGRLGCTKAALR